MVGALDHLARLPLDIRHIAYSAANLGYAWQALDWQLGPAAVPLAVATSS